MRHTSCVGCSHYLGNGMCKIDLESECKDGGMYEAYKEKTYGYRRGENVYDTLHGVRIIDYRNEEGVSFAKLS